MDWFTDRRIQIALVLLQLLICVPFINSFSIDLDEPFSVFWAQQDLNVALPFFAEGNNPPLHDILLHFWVKIFGIGPIAVRSLSLLFSLLTIPILYSFSKKLLDKPFAIVVCGFFIFSTFNHYHALEARNYSLMVLLAVLIFKNLYVLIFEKEQVFWRLAVWNALMLYTHYLGFFIIGCEVLIFLLFAKHLSVRKVMFFTASLGITALIYLPSLIVFIKRFSEFATGGTWVAEPHPTEIYGNVIRFLNGKEAVVQIGLIVALFVSLKIRTIHKEIYDLLNDKRKLFILSAFLIPYLGMFIFSIMIQPVFLDRYLLYTTPFLFLLVASVYKILSSKRYVVFYAVLGLLPMMIYCQYKPDNNRDADVMAAYVNDQLTGKDMVYLAPGYYDLTFIYYFDRELFKNYHKRRSDTSDYFQSLYTKAELLFNASAEQVFFVDGVSEAMYPENGIKDSLGSRYTLVDQREFKGGHFIYRYLND